MGYTVYVRSAQGVLLEQYPCACPLEGLSWLSSRFRAAGGFGEINIATCRSERNPSVTQWVLEIR